MTRASPSPIAPMPSSGCSGTPSLRTRMTSSGASRARATSAATATPPRGRPSTTTSLSRNGNSRLASCRPASDRSRNRMVTPSGGLENVYPARGHNATRYGPVPEGSPGHWQPAGSGQQRAQERAGAVAVGATGVLAGHEVGHPGVGQRADLGTDLILVADDGHVGRARGSLAVQHGPVGRQLTIDEIG